jgi:hypothetical protein
MEDLTYFYIDAAEGNLVGKRPETKTESDLARVVSLGKPLTVLEKFSAMVIVGKHWDWFDSYVLHLNDMDTWEKWEVPTRPEDAGEDYIAPERPSEPTWVTLRYSGNPMSIYTKQLTKALGINVQGNNVSLSEVNQNGIASVMAGATLAIEFGGTIFPLNFTADTKEGQSTLVFDTIEDFKIFAITFMQSRQTFFN